MTYTLNVTREEGWWIITIPELDGVTQARRLEDVEREAHDYIVVTEDVAPSSVETKLASLLVADHDYAADLEQIRDARDLAEQVAERARAQQIQVATNLHNEGIPLREIGDLLGLSHQRVHQLVSSAA